MSHEAYHCPFPDDFECRPEGRAATDRSASRRHVTELREARHRGRTLRLVDQLEERRRETARADDPSAVTPLPPRRSGHRVAADRDALLVHGTPDELTAAATLAGTDVAAVPGPIPEGLADRLALYRPTAKSPSTASDQLAAAEARFRGRRLRAAPLSIVSLHIVIKARTGPAPTRHRGGLGRTPSGASPTVAVIDTGIAAAKRSDRWLNEVERGALDIDPLDAFPAKGSVSGNGYLDFAAGHGTFAAGVVRQVDPEAPIRVYRALDSDGFGTELGVAQAMMRAVTDGAQILSLSLGVQTPGNTEPPAFAAVREWILDYARRHLDGQVPVVVASAGNFGTRRKTWPAASKDVIAVGGLTSGMEPSEWSSRGGWVDFSTVGEGVVSTFVPGQEDPEFGGTDSYTDPAWAVWTGTSFAAPQIAGAIARLSRERGIGVREAVADLRAAAPRRPAFGRAVRVLPGT